MSANLRLEPVTQDNVRAACRLKLRSDQEHLVAPVAWSLADAYTMPGIAWPRRRGHHRLTVGYHEGPNGPEEFYRRLGFRPTGEYNHGEAIAERTLGPASAETPESPGR